MTRRKYIGRRPWTRGEIAKLRKLYPNTSTKKLAAKMDRTICAIYERAQILGIKKSAKYLAGPDACRLRRGDNVGAAYRFQKGQVPFNKGKKGWQAGGRSAETRFKKGHFPANRDPDFYVLGALRENSEGYIDMRVSFEPGSRGWRALHLILWEDAHGPLPKGHVLAFKDRDKLNVDLDNLELISRADNMRRNSIHNLPQPLKSAIQLLGQLKRRINEKQIEDLRNHLFATLEDLRDKDKPMEIDRAKAVAGVAQVIVDSARVECEYIKLTGQQGSGFIPAIEDKPAAPGVLQPRLIRGKAQA